MAQAAYFVAQQIHAGWALFGIILFGILFGALVANLAHAIVLRKLGRSFGYALASFLLIAASLAIFFVRTFPTNQATNNWTVVPKNWNGRRADSDWFSRMRRSRFVAIVRASSQLISENSPEPRGPILFNGARRAGDSTFMIPADPLAQSTPRLTG